MGNILRLIITIFIGLFSIPSFSQDPIRISDSLRVIPITEHAFIHVSDQTTPEFGKFTSNGLIYIRNNEVLIMDTPPSEGLSRQLLEWMRETYPSARIKGVIVTHFHSDCLGGLKAFHEFGIPSYGHVLTPTLLKLKNDPYDAPRNVFKKKLILKIGGEKVISQYFGEAHTRDNIVGWIDDGKILFGGCMVKALNAGKGNLADANVTEWSTTVTNVQHQFVNTKIVVPGHGTFGDGKLLDFTIQLFK